MKFLKQIDSIQFAVTLFVCVAIMPFANAQSKINLSAGIETTYPGLDINNTIADDLIKPGVGINLGASYQLNNVISLHSGLGYSYFRTDIKVNTYNSFENATDIEAEDFEFRYQLNNFSETHRLSAITIPIAFQYETQENNLRFYAKAGVEANIFVSNSYTATVQNVTTTGYFPRLNAVLDRPEFAGFGSFDSTSLQEQNVSFKNSYNALLEVGVKQIFKNGDALYMGVFGKLGINNIAPETSNKGIVSYNSNAPKTFITTSVFEAIDKRASDKSIVSQSRLNVFGFAFRYEFNLSKILK